MQEYQKIILKSLSIGILLVIIGRIPEYRMFFSITMYGYGWILFGLVGMGMVIYAFLINALILKESATKLIKIPVLQGIHEGRKTVVWGQFPITILFEELIFRVLILGGFLLWHPDSVGLWIGVSSGVFSLYHVHTWFVFKDWRITGSFLLISFGWGIGCGFALVEWGFLAAFVLHWGCALIIYFYLNSKLP